MEGAGRSIGLRVVWGLALVSTGDATETTTDETQIIATFSYFRSSALEIQIHFLRRLTFP